MTRVILELRPDTERRLREKAEHSGQSLESYLQQLAEREAEAGPSPPPPDKPTLDELLTPVRQRFAESGMTDEELAALVEEAREEVWREKRNGTRP